MNVLNAPNRYPMPESLDRIGPLKLEAIPQDLTGMTVLDIGGYDGRFGHVALQRGAKSVLVLDNEEWRQYYAGTWPEPTRFDGLDYEQGDFLDLVDNQDWDVVLFFNVLYHCEDWEQALPKIRGLTKKILCLSTYWARGARGWHPYTESDTNYERATPTMPGLLKALGDAGFVDYPYLQVRDNVVVLRCQ